MGSENMSKVFDDDSFVKMYKQVEQFTGNFAAELIERSRFKEDLSKLDKVVILDNACGTGIVSSKLMAMIDDSTASKVELTCADYADAMVNASAARVKSESWPNAKVVKADAQDTKLPSSHFTHVYFSFGPMLIPNPIASIKECFRMLSPGGLLGTNTWEHIGWFQDWHDGLSGNPKYPSLPDHDTLVQGFAVSKERWDKPKFVRQHLENNGFVDVQVDSVPHQTTMPAGQAIEMVPQVMRIIYMNFWSEEQRENASLKGEAEADVVKHLREKYGSEEITWNWTGICATGRKPEHSEL